MVRGISNIEQGILNDERSATPGFFIHYSLLNIHYFANMDIIAFTKTLSESHPPVSLPVQLVALWYDGKGDWNTAHDLINDLEDRQSAWVHAYLHRKEGDIGNAGYWYRRAGKEASGLSLQEEWKELVEEFLNIEH